MLVVTKDFNVDKAILKSGIKQNHERKHIIEELFKCSKREMKI